MILSTGKGWAEAVHRHWRNDPWGLKLATGIVTTLAYAALAGACVLAYSAGGSAAALLGAAGLLVVGMVGLTASVFLRLPPWLAWWTHARTGTDRLPESPGTNPPDGHGWPVPSAAVRSGGR